MENGADRLVFGKKIKGALYLHKEGVSFLSQELRDILDNALTIATSSIDYNVVKFEKNSVSFLLYEDFEEFAFPALKYSTHVNFANGVVKKLDFSNRKNPPILHRKELLLPPNHPKIPKFSAITRLAESKGLFAEPTKIGFKEKWLELLTAANLKIVGPKLLEKDEEHAEVLRHRTALTRRDLSQPVQLLLLNGILDKNRSFFDYGCGQGTDFTALQNSGFKAYGWDPHHLPNGKRGQADIVNLGYVLNVIEDPHERLETLISAWGFAKKALCIAVMVSGKIDLNLFKPYRDGVLTSRNTFQKYFSQQELRDYVAEATGATPISLAPGIISVFKDKTLEQDVAFKRSVRSYDTISNISVPRIYSEIKFQSKISLLEVLTEEIAKLWECVLNKGRLIDVIEFPTEITDSLRSKRISPQRLLSLVVDKFKEDPQFKLAQARRREDLLLHLALGFFPASNRSKSLSVSISRDIRYFYGTQKHALANAREQLFSAGDLSCIKQAIDLSVSQHLGAMKDVETFRCIKESLDSLPLILRIIIHCAGILRGGIDGADFIDIKKDGKNVVFLTCLDSSLHFPVISERNKVDLRRAKSYVEFPKETVIYWKSKFMSTKDANYKTQTRIDEKLLKLGIIKQDCEGPDYITLKKLLTKSQ